MKLISVAMAALSLLSVCNISAQNVKPRASAEPGWITKIPLDYKSTSLDAEAEDGYIDLDYEKQVSLKEQCIYVRRSVRIISEAGVQNGSQISIDFDPSYEHLVFHTIRILRDGKAINKLDLSRIKTIQQEKDLDNFIYNGTLNAVLFLDDVRKGDIIEYSYSTRGFNSIFNGKYSDVYGTQFTSPFYNIYYKLVVPQNRKVNIKNSNETAAPDVSSNTASTIYEWRKTNVKAMHIEDNIPTWYDPYPEIMVSEYSSWKEVSDWALSLFPVNTPLSPELKSKVAQIQKENQTAEERILSVLHFVQDDIRYMGIEMGAHSHKPSGPNKVFAQRFGDCKEKSLLFCAMLRPMGIEAAPVLINADYKKTLFTWLPCSTDFDHCTVRVKLNEKFYWFDPTISYQRGSIDDVSYPDYQCGLVITDTTTALTAIPRHTTGSEMIKEIFTIPDMSGTVKLEVITTHTGDYADIARSDFKNNSLYEMQQSYQDFYLSYFDDAKSDSLRYEDNEKTGVFITKEFYTIKNFWNDKNGSKTVSFTPFVIESVLEVPKDRQRTMPFSIGYPANYHEEMVINLPAEWKVKKTSSNFTCPGFEFDKRASFANRQVTLHYDYRSLKDYIDPSEADDYLSNIEKARRQLDYGLSYDDEPVDKRNAKRIGIAALIISFVIAGVVWWTQKQPSA